MPRKLMRKLVDIGAGGSPRLESALEKFLDAHSIKYEKQRHEADGFVRYHVSARDLSAAQAVLPALAAMAEGGPDVA